MIEFFVRRPVTTIVVVLFFVILGFVSYFNLAIELTPKVDLPIVTVTCEYPGATPIEVEVQVVKKVEDAVSELSEIKKLTSRSYENVGIVTIEFEIEADANIKTMEAKDKIEAILNDLPSGAEKPLVEKFDPLALPVMNLVLTSDTVDSRDLYEFADKTLKSKLSSIEGVASVDIIGGKERQINISVDPILAKQYFIGISDIIRALGQRNLNLPGGMIEKEENSINVRFLGEFTSVDEIGHMELISRDGSMLHLAQIATITDGHKEIESIARFNAKDAVGISIIKSNDGNTVAIAQTLHDHLDELRSFLPKGVDLKIATDNSRYILRETNDTLFNILMGIVLTVIVLYLFTGNGRTTFIAAIIIPASIVSALFLIDLSGFTINMITLLAIAMAMGTLIANAIVVIESVLEHLDVSEDSQTAAIKGTRDVVDAIIASAGTNLVVFTPIAFVGGTPGPFMRQFGLTVVYATIFSLIASFSLTPMLCGLILRPRPKGMPPRRRMVRLTQRIMRALIVRYKPIFDWTLRHSVATIVLVLAVCIGSATLVSFIGNEFIPASDENKIDVDIVAPQGSTIDRTLEIASDIEQIFAPLPEVKSIFTRIGNNGVENALVTVNLIPNSERKRSDADIIEALLPKAAAIPGAEIQLIRGKTIGLGNADITAHIYGDDYEQLIAYASDIVERMNSTGILRSATSSYKKPKSEIRFTPNEAAMTIQGIPYASLAQAIRASIYGDDSNIFKERGEEYDINIEMDEYYKNSFDDIEQINIITKKGLLPITELGTVQRSKAIPAIWRRDRDRIIQIDGYLARGTAGEAMTIIGESLNSINFDDGYGYRWVGDAENQEESEEEIGRAFLLAAILTFMVLAGLLNSAVHPFTIGSSIITSFSGVFLLMFFMRSSVNLASMLSMVMLVGLVVNNSILMIDATMRFRQSGLEIQDALWKGVKEKFRAILMTSIAIVFGVLPQLTSHDVAKASMGAVLAGGMIASIIFTFILTPTIFLNIEKLRLRWRKTSG